MLFVNWKLPEKLIPILRKPVEKLWFAVKKAVDWLRVSAGIIALGFEKLREILQSLREKMPKWVTAELVIGAIALTSLLVEPVMDILPIDQSHWWHQEGQYYYFDEKGDRVTGWRKIGENRYYLDPAAGGAMYTGWLDTEDGRYYLRDDGRMHTGWLKLQENWYYMDPDGKMVTGWLGLPEGKYYLRDDGRMHTGWLKLDGTVYYFGEDGRPHAGWMEQDGKRRFFDDAGRTVTGWLTLEDERYYLDQNGHPLTGWLELDNKQYYLDEEGVLCIGWTQLDGHWYYFGDDGAMTTGWVEIDGVQHYLQEDGKAATGQVKLNKKTYYFSSKGGSILLVNRWKKLSSKYEAELVQTRDGAVVAAECADALVQMLDDCAAAGGDPYICSSYRTIQMQQDLFDRQVAIWEDKGQDEKTAYETARQIVAVPGTSEHHTGLAVDITDATYVLLDEGQAQTETQKWLMENSWRYGFILRYPDGTTKWTGIIYEPWHYRYVGRELAAELYELDLCLEEYLDRLTKGEPLK